MKLRSFFSLLTAVVIVLLSIGVAGFFWLTAQNPLSLLQSGGQTGPAAAIFIPKQSPLMVSLLVNPDRLEAFRLAIANPGDRRRARAELEQLKQSLLEQRGLNYERDIKPWLGSEITLAVTTPDIDRDNANGQQPGYLLTATAEDPQKAKEFLQVLWQKRALAGTDLVFEQYAGVKIIYGTPTRPSNQPNQKASQSKTSESVEASNSEISESSVSSLASAVVGDRFVLFANHPKVLRDAINNVQAGGLSLSQNSIYQQALRQLPASQIGTVFINLPQLSVWLGSQPSATSTETALAEQPHLYDSLIMALQLDQQGLLAETSLLTAPGQTLPKVKPALSKPAEALQFIPAASTVSASGVNLQQLWQQFSGESPGSDALSFLVNRPLATIQARWGVDPPTDLFSWVQKEYALGLLPNRGENQQDWVFVAQKSPDAEAAIQKLDAIAQKQGLSVGPLNLGEQEVFAWTKLSTAANKRRKKETLALQADVQGVRATVDEYEIFATSVEAMNQVLQARNQSLLSTADFQGAIAPLADNNDGYLYLDWQSVKTQVEEQIPLLRLAEIVAKPFFDHLRSLTVSSYGSEPTARRGAVFVRFKDA